MNYSRIYAEALIVVAAVTASFGWYSERLRVLHLEAELIRHQAGVERGVRDRGAILAEVRRAQEENSRLEKALAVHSANAPLSAEDKAKATLAADIGQRWRELIGDEYSGALLLEKVRAGIRKRFAPLYQQLGLSPEDAERVTQLLADKKLAPSDVASAELKQGDGTIEDVGELERALSAERAQIEEQISGTLGAQGYQDYRQFEAQAGQSSVVAGLQTALADSGNPLSDDQAQQLQALMHANHIGHVSSKVLVAAQSFLAPAQLEVLQARFQEQQANVNGVPAAKRHD